VPGRPIQQSRKPWSDPTEQSDYRPANAPSSDAARFSVKMTASRSSFTFRHHSAFGKTCAREPDESKQAYGGKATLPRCRFMREFEAVVKSLEITRPLRVLDLGCGDGTTAVPLAHLGTEVVGIDIAKNLVDAGNKRAAEAGLSRLKFQEGDACNLAGVSDHSFDLTLSVFGAMFAPKPFDVARTWLSYPARWSYCDGQLIPSTFLRFAVAKDKLVIHASAS
jgi:SAM-dependent methyltransferase